MYLTKEVPIGRSSTDYGRRLWDRLASLTDNT